MQSQVIRKFGGPEVFELTDIPKPTLKSGHVLIKVFATSVNPIDTKVRSGMVSKLAPAFPAILHGDVAGIIEATAPDVKDFKIGDEVYGCAGGFHTDPGALAEFMLADAQLIAKKPKSLSMIEAAALPLVSITACMALFNKANLTEDKNILIHGGVGGVGHVAVQLAKWCKAKVSVTVRKKADFSIVQSFGADEIINAEEEEVEQYVSRLTANQGFEVIFDTIGGINLDRSFIAAAANGTVVTTAARSTHDLTPLHSKGLSLHCVFMLHPLLTGQGRSKYRKILNDVAKIADAGGLKPLIDPKHFTLESVSDAHAYLESGKARGKVVLTIYTH